MNAGAGTGVAIGVAIKPAPRHVDVDPLTAAVTTGGTPSHIGAADLAALETALRLRDRWGGDVVAACAVPAAPAAAGPEAPDSAPDPADPVLRDALARGATRAVRAATPAGTPGAPGTLAHTTRALARAFADCAVIVCGDYSADGGTGAVPALLAAATGHAQALGLLDVRPDDREPVVVAERRLDGGRRERLRVTAPMVLSVEGATARVRRATLAGALAAVDAAIEVIDAEPDAGPPPVRTVPYRPRARVLMPPDGTTPDERVRHLLGVAEEREPPRRVDAEPRAAAREIIEQLQRWGYLGTGGTEHGTT